jgi:hypothetical protein
MFVEIVAVLGTEMRNQQETVRAFVFQLRLPVVSLTFTLALLVNVAADAGQADSSRQRAPRLAAKNPKWRRSGFMAGLRQRVA